MEPTSFRCLMAKMTVNIVLSQFTSGYNTVTPVSTKIVAAAELWL